MNPRKPLNLLFVLLAFPAGASALLMGRNSAPAVLLPNGNYMVIGGSATDVPGGRTKITEIFFTSAGAWGFGPDMNLSRSSHTATLLGDGRVLVTGGFANGGPVPLDSAEIYIATAAGKPWGEWKILASNMSTRRAGHTATLINKGANAGKVIVCGGQTATDETLVTNTCDLFNPASETFAAAAAMTSSRAGHTASATNRGTVFISGGRVWSTAISTWVYLPTNELYDGSLTWTPVTSLLQGRAHHSATVLNNGNIIISGGYAGTTSSANVFAAEEGGWFTGGGAGQNGGSHGYLESAEIFDPNGGRVQVSGQAFQTMPYRNSGHAALLLPEGSYHMYGGFGNIPAKFAAEPTYFELDTKLGINITGSNTATINSASELKFKLATQLPRPVSGRVVDGDFFISQPAKGGDPFAASEKDRGDPAIASDNMKVWMQRSTAPVDGSPIGSMIKGKGGGPGAFSDVIWPRNPAGNIVFAPATVTSENSVASANTLSFTPVGPSQSGDLATGIDDSITANVNFSVPAIYIDGTIAGSATIVSAVISPATAKWSLTLTTGNASFWGVTVLADPLTGQGKVVIPAPDLAFGKIEGTLQNNSTWETLVAGAPGAGQIQVTAVGEKLASLTLRVLYTVDQVNLSKIEYKHDISTIVIRGMIFSDNVSFIPKEAKWDFGKAGEIPRFNHTVFLTPAADAVQTGGRHCETDDPYFACGRSTRAYINAATDIADIPASLSKWAPSAKLKTKRAFHASTLLPSGAILTCGGSDGGATLQSCELLEPPPPGKQQTPAWVFTSSMTIPRARHTATLLPNGNVLAAGGTTGASSAAVNTAEIYYPASSRRWVGIANMTSRRQNHTATLLPDGNVLVAGGSTNDGYSDTAELFIATAATWVSVGSLPQGGRSQHTATLLKNGNVLVAGGVNGMGAIKTTEIYNYATRVWSAGPDMIDPKYSHSANLLMDGRVIVTGGSNNFGSQKTAEIYDGAAWSYAEAGETSLMTLARANHRSVLLPNGKLMITGGEAPGVSQGSAEGYDVDFSSFQLQGEMQKRSNHTSVLMHDNRIMNIGGWDGNQCLDTTDVLYFSYPPDDLGLDPKSRNPAISTWTVHFDRGETVTLESGTTNFHGLTEASGGGAAGMNSSFSGPRVYLQAIDSPSGFLTDLTTRLYTLYGGPNADWERTLSSITVIMPAAAAELPYGWYHLRAAANGQFSEGRTVQVTVPRPVGYVVNITTGPVLTSTSIQWNWQADAVMQAAPPDGYALFAASNSVFITTTAYSSPASYIQGGLAPNTKISIKIAAYNTGGYGSLTGSGTYYTLAVSPKDLKVVNTSFETVTISWDPAGNSDITPYEVTMWNNANPPPTGPTSTPITFINNYVSTYAAISSLSPNKLYTFRVQAKNGSGITTGYSNEVSTITVGNVTNLKGTASGVSAINWAWTHSVGAEIPTSGIYYEVYEVTAGTQNAVFLDSTTANSYTQYIDRDGVALSTNTAYTVGVNAAKDFSGTVRGPVAYTRKVYTKAAPPLIGVPEVFNKLSTGSLTVHWRSNGNPSSTVYILDGNLEVAGIKIKDSSFTITAMPDPFPAKADVGNLKPNSLYSFTLTAINGDGIPATPTLDLGSKYTDAQSPANLRATAISMSGITLAWQTGENPPNTVYQVRASTADDNLDTGPYITPVPLPFSRLYTSDTFAVTGLLTATTYYFDVKARNGELKDTAHALSPALYTLPGPEGTPSGSVGGTSDPAGQVTIAGTLPDNRFVSITVPGDAFPSQTAIAISSWSPSVQANPCKYTLGSPPHPLQVAIYSQSGSQPQTPLTLTLKFDGPSETNESTRIGNDISKLVLARYNPVSGQCLPLETKIDMGPRTITATLNHFSLFQLMVSTAASNLSAVRVYPNPLYINRGPNLLTIDRMPALSKIRIYTLSGDKVWEGAADSTGLVSWRGVNSSGATVGSGIYLAVIDSSAGKKVVKIAVER